MALSDWDRAAWNEQGEPSGEGMPCGNTALLYVYKNRVVVDDENLWQPEGSYSRPTVCVTGRRDPGPHHVAGFRFVTGAGPQSSVFVLAAHGLGAATRLFGSIGCSGYDRAFDLVGDVCRRYGLAPGDREAWGESWGYDGRRGTRTASLISPPGSRLGKLQWWAGSTDERRPQVDAYVGVRADTFRDFVAWCRGVATSGRLPDVEQRALDAWISSVEASGCLRSNQGDGFIVSRTAGPLAGAQTTKAGEALQPIAATLLDIPADCARHLPWHSHAEWLDMRVRHAEKTGRLCPGLKRRAAPAASLRLGPSTPKPRKPRRQWNRARRLAKLATPG